ncbi:MAG: DNA repair protein RecO [Candidatus Omnitrophica bacterium]|nr:DNA repair protein RecO [Candidatus Omnitrophota bacterium]
MAATKTLAFVLKTQDYRDTSLLGVFLTQEHGKIRGILKGVRDARARYGSSLEPFSLNEILFYKRRRGGDLHQVTQADLVDLFTPVRDDLERLSYASYFTELLDALVEVEDPQPEIFDLLKDSLEFLSSGASARRSARIFEVKLLELLGLMPEIKACVVCRTESPDPAFFSVSAGGVRCAACQARSEKKGQASFSVSKGTLQFLSHVLRADLKALASVKVSQEVGEELEKILRRFVDYHLTYPLKSIIFLEKMGYTG